MSIGQGIEAEMVQAQNMEKEMKARRMKVCDVGCQVGEEREIWREQQRKLSEAEWKTEREGKT